MSYVYARRTAAVSWGGGTVRTVCGEAWHASDPFVRDNPDKFDSHPTVVRGQPGEVEQATSAPGEKRRTKRRTQTEKQDDDADD